MNLVRGLSLLFWGLPLALIVCVQTAKGDWLRPLHVLPSLLVTALLLYALRLLSQFQPQERIWAAAVERARVLATINFGLSPFLYWWSRLPSEPFYNAMVGLMAIAGLCFLFALNRVLCRLTAMLPDESLRAETLLFSTLNRYLLLVTAVGAVAFLAVQRVERLPSPILFLMALFDRVGLWVSLFFILLPMALTMALIWKIKDAILTSVFQRN